MPDRDRLRGSSPIPVPNSGGFTPVPGQLTALGASGYSQGIITEIYRNQQFLHINADAGSFVITGTAATLTINNAYAIVADAGSYTITGTIATLSISSDTSEAADSWFNGIWWQAPTWGASWWGEGNPSFEIVADAGSLSITGTDADLLVSETIIAADAGSFVITGTEATFTLLHAYSLAVDSGSFSISGTAVDFTNDEHINCEPGSFIISGTKALKRGPSRAIRSYGGWRGYTPYKIRQE